MNVFTKRILKHWNRLPREMVDSPFIEVFKTHVARALEDMFSGEHGDGGAGLTIGLGDLIGLFQSL